MRRPRRIPLHIAQVKADCLEHRPRLEAFLVNLFEEFCRKPKIYPDLVVTRIPRDDADVERSPAPEIVAAVALAGEVSLASAISSQDWVSAHERFGRNR